MNVALLGPTCAGKTTCSSWLCDQFPLRHLSTGQILRENRALQTALGILTRKYVERGELVPDEIVNAMLEEAVRKWPLEEGLLLDAFPGTLYQARFLEELFRALNRKLDAVIFMQAPDNVIFERAARRIPNRPDDRQEIIRNRIQVFQRTTGPVIDFFRKENRLVFLDASRSIDAVCASLAEIFELIQTERPLPSLTAEQHQVIDQYVAKPVAGKVSQHLPSFDLVVMGAPGSGKGTHSAFLADNLNLPHVATGNLFRENLNDDTIMGKIARTYIDRGQLVPDDVSEAMVSERLARSDVRDGFILDGFPRTAPQARALDEIMANMNRAIDGVIYLAVPDEEIVERISGRWICPVCQSPYHLSYKKPKVPGECDKDGATLFQRDDDTPETVRARLKVFHGQTVPVFDYYREEGILIEVPATGEVADVDQRLLEAVKTIKRR